MSVSFSAHAQGIPRGDVNQDGAVNISDVTCLIDNLLKGVLEGDVDQDGAVNISDVTSLIDYLLKGSWPDEPVTPPDTHEYVDLGLPSGTLWATCNVGASSPEEYGDYFAWGETEPKDYYDWSNYKWCNGSSTTLTKYCFMSSYGYNGFVDGKGELDPEDDAAYVNWGSSWRIPTNEQMQELVNSCTSMWTTQNGMNGRLVTGPNGASLFLPVAGWRYENSLNDAGSIGNYFSRTLAPPYGYGLYFPYYAYGMGFGFLTFSAGEGFCPRCDGMSVRAVRVLQN